MALSKGEKREVILGVLATDPEPDPVNYLHTRRITRSEAWRSYCGVAWNPLTPPALTTAQTLALAVLLADDMVAASALVDLLQEQGVDAVAEAKRQERERIARVIDDFDWGDGRLMEREYSYGGEKGDLGIDSYEVVRRLTAAIGAGT